MVVSRFLGLPLEYLGAVPQDKFLNQAVMQQKPVTLANPGAKSAQAFAEITARLMHLETEGKVRKRGMAAFFSHIVANKKVNVNGNV